MVLLGMVPVLMQVPPITSFRAIKATRFPCLAPWMEARCPEGPEPIARTSASRRSRWVASRRAVSLPGPQRGDDRPRSLGTRHAVRCAAPRHRPARRRGRGLVEEHPQGAARAVHAGKFVWAHSARFDHDGNIYVVEWVDVGRVTTLVKV